MQLVILAGGLGTRLRPLTLHRPKALVPLVDRPQIAHVLDALPPSCEEVIIAVNYMFEQVRDFFRERQFGVAVRVVEEPEPMGTGGAIKNLQRWLHGPFAVYNGDVVDTIEFDRLVAAHEKAQGVATIALWPVDDPSAYGVVAVEKGRITRFVEKPAKGEAPSNPVNAGRYVFEPQVLDLIDAGHTVSLEREVFPRLIEQGLFPYRYEGFWSDAGTLPNYLNAQRLLLEAGQAKISPDADVTAGSLGPPVYVAAGAYVDGRVGLQVGRSIGTFFGGGPVALARDTRLSGPMLARATASGLMSAGCEVIDLGIVPTPCAEHYVTKAGGTLKGAVVVTASHNPREFNGLKAIDARGMEMRREDEEAIESIFFEERFRVAPWSEVGSIRSDDTAVSRYLEAILGKVDVDAIRSEERRVGKECGCRWV